MNYDALLRQEVQDFIQENTTREISALALQKNPFPDLDYKLILNQIEARAKCQQKLPTWHQATGLIFPSKVSIEQTSSEIAAAYKSQLVSGNRLIDMTGGFGVDSYYFAKQMNAVIHCELDENLSQWVAHNYKKLGSTNITCVANDGLTYLEQQQERFDWIYIDPSRRNEVKGKVFLLKDCTPDVVSLMDCYFQYSNQILIKTAPLLDLKAGLKDFQFVKCIHIVAVENEVKELLWELEYHYSGAVTIKTRNFTKNHCDTFDFEMTSETLTSLALPQQYLYEPNSALMKSGGFVALANHYNIPKLHSHSHLFTSDSYIDFPGRRFEIVSVFPYTKKDMATHFTFKKANISIRNFPESVETIRKKWNISDGGTLYSFFTTDKNDQKIVLLCHKIN
ncbi:THUMP-like domain-containing protein [Flavobacterium aciduliphilum]|uniref:Uncharacterized protein n=1 Tax=Flavobacterium aciduliphilum TaxID=1101402 RepID=A0A328YH17_9FLAO|nr:class I SAM-dependent methyltransferase [Flavobacterium aciduliphilum]RAR72614.1 hypothetical protein CLV55_105184 [Flavobacterium aciduliphilum]